MNRSTGCFNRNYFFDVRYKIIPMTAHIVAGRPINHPAIVRPFTNPTLTVNPTTVNGGVGSTYVTKITNPKNKTAVMILKVKQALQSVFNIIFSYYHAVALKSEGGFLFNIYLTFVQTG